MLKILCALAAICSLAACRKDGDDAETELQWSCARLLKNSPPLVSPDCLQEMQRDNSKVLQYYHPIAQKDDKKVLSYILVAKKSNASSKAAR